jgi:putative effector of murein hydrolase
VLLRALGVTSRTAWGLAMGASSHGVGTARAAQEGEVEGASAGLAIGLMGVATALLAPVAAWVLGYVLRW